MARGRHRADPAQDGARRRQDSAAVARRRVRLSSLPMEGQSGGVPPRRARVGSPHASLLRQARGAVPPHVPAQVQQRESRREVRHGGCHETVPHVDPTTLRPGRGCARRQTRRRGQVRRRVQAPQGDNLGEPATDGPCAFPVRRRGAPRVVASRRREGANRRERTVPLHRHSVQPVAPASHGGRYLRAPPRSARHPGADLRDDVADGERPGGGGGGGGGYTDGD